MRFAVVAQLGILEGEVSCSFDMRNRRISWGPPDASRRACSTPGRSLLLGLPGSSWGLRGSDAWPFSACFCSEMWLCVKVPSYNSCSLSASLPSSEQGQKHPPAASRWALRSHTPERCADGLYSALRRLGTTGLIIYPCSRHQSFVSCRDVCVSGGSTPTVSLSGVRQDLQHWQLGRKNCY